MGILTIPTKFEAFECKFEHFKQDSNANSNHSNQIRRIWMQIWTMQIATIQTRFERFECIYFNIEKGF